MIRFTLDESEAVKVVQSALDRKVKEKALIVRREADAAAERIRNTGFGPLTDKPPGALRVRSGDALRTIDSVPDENEDRLLIKVGSINPPPEVRKYLVTHEPEHDLPYTILRAKHRQSYDPDAPTPKLAFPPGDAGAPARDSRGVQQFWLSTFLRIYKSLGFAHVIVGANAVLARRQGSRTYELVFIRRESVKIPARRPISRQIEPTRKALLEALGAERGNA